MENNFQRIGSVSNTQVGRDFEDQAAALLAEQGLDLATEVTVEIGHGNRRKVHRFDLGSHNPPVIIECKAHTWTAGGNMPSAKITTWIQEMYHLSLAPSEYRKLLVVQKDCHPRTGETLAAYFCRLKDHLIPPGVEIWEVDIPNATMERVNS